MPNGPLAIPVVDATRLEVLNRLGLLDLPPQEEFERITRIARRLLDVPVALVTLVDKDRQFFLSASGLPEPWATRRETPLTHSFCQYVVADRAALVVTDARSDPRVQENRAIEELGVVAYLGVPMTTKGGLVVGALCAIDSAPRQWSDVDHAAMTDLAALAASEIVLHELAREQDGRIQEETAKRIKAQEELGLKRRLEALGQLAGGVAHDFANVLQAVQAGVRLAENNLDRDPAKVRRMLTAVADSARRGNSVTRRLLGFARRGELRTVCLRIETVLTDLQEVLVHTLNCPGLDLRIEMAPALPAILVDRGELEAVIVNLATNARDAMPGGGLLRFAASSCESGDPPCQFLRLTVEDSGCGMDADTLARAGDAFFTTKPEGQGTGLGLAMARDFAQQSGGIFEIASAPGRGTVITLLLPAVPEPAE